MTTRDQNQTAMTRRAFVVGVGAAAVPVAVATPAAANHEAPPQGVFGEGIDGGSRSAFFRGVRQGYFSYAAPADDLETLVDRSVNEFRANEDAWIRYGDWAAAEHDFQPLGDTEIEVTFAYTRGRRPLAGDDEVVTTLTTAFDDETNSYEHVTWEIEAAEDPEYQAILFNKAAENAADELQQYRREFIGDEESDHELPDDEYVSELVGRYWSAVGLGEDGETVLELLLGDLDG